jgi:hypothetical protein
MASRRAADERRDPELEDVLTDLEERLAAIEHVRSREYDDQLSVVEALAAPYALAFLHEIRRLDALLRERQRSRRATKQQE